MNPSSEPYVIVVGIDYSETGDLAFEQALEAASSHPSSEVHAVNVVQLAAPIDGLGYVPSTRMSVTLDVAEAQLHRYVESKLDAFRRSQHEERRAPGRVVPHLLIGGVGYGIAQLASDLEADLVVVGTHGRRGAARVLIGSVAELVVRLAPCPVLVVRPRGIIELPKIEPPCPECVKTRRATHGERLWCDQHSERHGQRHTYHQGDRVSADGSMPLVFHG